jgi:SAM-dependent methyltransferase
LKRRFAADTTQFPEQSKRDINGQALASLKSAFAPARAILQSGPPQMRTALRRLARRCIYTSNTVRYRVELPRLLEALRVVGKVDRAVDIGAAGGYYVVNAYLHFANRVHAIEYDAHLCDLLRQELVRFPERCTWQQGSILSLPVESAGADLVACTQVLEHIDDELRAFHELTRILKPGGYLLLAVPHPPAPWPEPGHVREGYRVEDLINLGNRFGLKTIHSDYYLTSSTQKIIHLAHRFCGKLPALLPLSELKYSRDERLRQRPYGILALYRKQESGVVEWDSAFPIYGW